MPGTGACQRCAHTSTRTASPTIDTGCDRIVDLAALIAAGDCANPDNCACADDPDRDDYDQCAATDIEDALRKTGVDLNDAPQH